MSYNWLRETSFSKALILFEAFKEKDSLTAMHSLDVACIAKVFHELLNTHESSEMFFLSGLLHDVGKLKWPEYLFHDNIVRKGSPEMAIIKLHPEYSRSILINMGFSKEIVTAAYLHHERQDGSGYPMALKGNDIPFSAKVIAIIDSFSALIEDRSYRAGFSFDKAMSKLQEDSYLYESDIFDCFVLNIDQILFLARVEIEQFIKTFNYEKLIV